jgi:hypothetical protein
MQAVNSRAANYRLLLILHFVDAHLVLSGRLVKLPGTGSIVFAVMFKVDQPRSICLCLRCSTED